MATKKKSYTKLALALSIFLLILWGILGTGTSLAWFIDTTPTHKNTFLIGDLNMTVSHRLENGDYEVVTSDTKLFDDEALYEPGYVQVVILKVENNGDVPFDYKLSVDVNEVTTAKSVLGNDIYLPEYLRYGVIFTSEEDELTEELNRTLAVLKSTGQFPEKSDEYPLNLYSGIDSETVGIGDARYIAIIVRMPEDVGNIANYTGTTPPSVKLGITVMASQEGTLQ